MRKRLCANKIEEAGTVGGPCFFNLCAKRTWGRAFVKSAHLLFEKETQKNQSHAGWHGSVTFWI